MAKNDDCTHNWKAVRGGFRCTHCSWYVDDNGPLPEKGLGIGKFKFKEDEEEGGPTRKYIDQD